MEATRNRNPCSPLFVRVFFGECNFSLCQHPYHVSTKNLLADTWKWVMSHMEMSHVTHGNESCHTHWWIEHCKVVIRFCVSVLMCVYVWCVRVCVCVCIFDSGYGFLIRLQGMGAAVCCSVLLCVAVCCSVLQCVAVCCSVLQCVAVCCSVLQCVAMS